MTVKVLCVSYRKYLDATSTMYFFSPYMDNVRRGEVCARRCCSASACRIHPSVMDRFYISMFSHTTVGLVSHNIPM